MEYIAFGAHKRYTLASVERATGSGILREERLPHRRGAIRDFLGQWDPGSPVAVETVGNWYWLVDEIEAAGMVPQLVHARKAKLNMVVLWRWLEVARFLLPHLFGGARSCRAVGQ